jgi:outer membrane biosynthesis protein TonB
MRNRQHALALGLLATTALSVGVVVAAAVAATVNDYYGRWSKADCAEEWVQFADGKVSQFSNRFQPVETADAPSAAAARRPAPAAPAPAAAAPKPAEPAKPATATSTDDQPRNPATARRLVNNPNEQPRNPATARKIAPDPKPAPAAKAPTDAKAPAKPAAPAAATAPTAPAKPAAKGKTMDLPATIKIDGDNLSVETQEKGRKPRREVYRMVDRDTLVLDATFVDGRRIPPITRDAVTYKRCK